VRANKKKGLKSKKELREQVCLFNYIVAFYTRIQRRMNQIQEEAKERLKEIATQHGYVVGKWCAFLFR
jgi:tRNA(Ser,Leu) C12 N-acetylase TAN1